MKHHHRLALALAFALLLLPTGAPVAAQDADDPTPAAQTTPAAESEETWNVNDPPGDWTTITIDTTETTWSDLDVSPDGQTIVFDMLGDLYSVPITGGEATALTDDIAWNFQPRFSPDGSRIAFISDRSGAENLWIMAADGSEPYAVTDEREHLVHTPSWSPDGDFLVIKKGYMSTRSIEGCEIWMVHHSGGGGVQLVERPHGNRDQKTMSEPAFSVDGRYVYFSQDTTSGRVWQYDKDSTGQIFTIQRYDTETGQTETFVSGPGGAIRPTPSPDGAYLAFVKRTPAFTSALYLKDLASGNEWPLYDQLDRDLQETNGTMGNTSAFSWTPDSQSIVFWAGGKIRRIDVESHEVRPIPVHIKVDKRIQAAVRTPVHVAPDEVDVRMLRWVTMSPRGDRVVFQALGHLYVRDLASGRQQRLTNQTDEFEFYPSFSPDGRSIVYTTWNDQQLGSVRIVSAGGGAGETISTTPGHYVEPRFSPDGQRIVYRKIGGGYLLSPRWSIDPGIYTVDVAGGEPSRVTDSGFGARFSPSGERILFMDGVDFTELALKSVNLDGLEERTHLQGAKVTEFSVSPDGRWVAFTQQFNAWVAPLLMTGQKVAIGSSTTSYPIKQVSRRAGENLHWSGDSRTLFWANGATLYSRDLRDAFSFLEGAPDELPEPVEEGIDLGFRVPADTPQGTIALTGGRIVTMRNADTAQEVIESGVVLVEGNRIAAVGSAEEVAIPGSAVTVDVSGKTIIPGLVDVHAHGAASRSQITPQQNWGYFANLAFGVTTTHDPSNDTASIFSAAELQRSGAIVGPRLFSTGRILYGAYSPGATAQIDSLDDARFHLRRLRDVGAISVKSYNQPRRDQRQQVLAAARELEVLVVPEGGAKFQTNMTQVVDGHTGIEHAIPLATAYNDVRQLWSQTDVGYTPTFVVAYGGLSGENYWYDRTNVWENEHLMRYTPRRLVEPRAIRRRKAPDAHYNHIHVARFAKELRDEGVDVLIGAHGQRDGLAAHWEMWMMEQGGFTPWEAIRGATADGARYLGMDGDIGSIEVGKLADLAIIEGNPVVDIRQSEHVTHTMINGRLYETETMNQIAPDEVERDEFFFERSGGDTIHPSTVAWIEELRRTHGWDH
jgi:Tol biopolymer transport system component/imidazolonepropionase-like amidohydrolase